MIIVKNAHLSVEIDEAQGAEIRGIFTPDGRNALAWYDWSSPTPVGKGASYGSSEMDWLSGYRGGWQETIPNAGQVCVVNGVEMGFHGDASRTRWSVIEQGSDWCTLETSTRFPITVRRTMRLDPNKPVLHIEGQVSNDSDLEVDFLWGHHPAFPSVDGGRIDLPEGCTIHPDVDRSGDLRVQESEWPIARSHSGVAIDLSEQPAVGAHRLLYVTGNKAGWSAVRQPEPYVSVAMAWDVAKHPYNWLWTMRGTPEYPWYGRASMFALEAQSSWPYDGLANAISRGQGLKIAPKAKESSWLTLAIIPNGSNQVTGVNKSGDVTFKDAEAK